MPKVHFSKFAHSLCCRTVWRICRICCKSSSQLLLKMRMSSIYTTTNALVKGPKMSSISIIKVAGAFVNSNGMTNQSKSDQDQLGLTSLVWVVSVSSETWYCKWPPRSKQLKCQKKRGEHTVNKTTMKRFVKTENNCKIYIVVVNLSFYKMWLVTYSIFLVTKPHVNSMGG